MRTLRLALASIIAAGPLMLVSTPASAAKVFSSLAGSWSGSGTLRLANGKREKLRCTAYYTKKGSNGLGLAIRCASPASQINMRGVLRGGGSAVTGTWEERTFNAGGSVSGTATNSSLRLSIRGSVSGSLSISVSGKRNSVTMSTANAGSVSLRFSRR